MTIADLLELYAVCALLRSGRANDALEALEDHIKQRDGSQKPAQPPIWMRKT